MRRMGWGRLVFAGLAVVAALGAAPAAPSYHGVEKAIGRVRDDWAKPGAAEQPNAAGWNALFDATLDSLRGYAAATTDNDRLVALNRLHQIAQAMGYVSWPPAVEVREALREWLRPRVRIAWAGRRLVERVRVVAPLGPDGQANHEKWVRFVDSELGQALRQYDGAATVAQRQDGLKRVYAALDALQAGNARRPWAPAQELQTALNGLYNLPNLDISIDAPTLAPNLAQNLVTTGPVRRRQYVSMVTAGPWLGWGLIASDDGIAFYNRQAMTSVTNVWDFNQQVQRDRQGRRAAKMYEFGAVQSDNAVLTITVVIRPSGISIHPSYSHDVGADLSTTPTAGHGLARAIAGLLGYNQERITQLAWENAIPQIRAGVVSEAQEVATERTNQEAAQRNAQLARYLIGNDRVMFNNILIEGLSLRSRPGNALVGGKIEYLNARGQVGADAPQPPDLFQPDAGVSADVHLSSVMTNFTRGYLESDAVRGVRNLMVVTRTVPPGQPLKEGVKVSENVDYPGFLNAVQQAQAANDPKAVAIRVKKPGAPPEFGVDSRGFLVALVPDFQIEVPVPPNVARGGGAIPPAKVFRITSPRAEFLVSFKIETLTEKKPLRLTGRIEGFDPGPNARVFAVNEDENQATPLNAFAGVFVLGGLRTKLMGQPIDVPLSNLNLRGFAIRSMSPLDPSGWIRVNLARVSASPAAGIQTAPSPEPPPTPGGRPTAPPPSPGEAAAPAATGG